ncbi:MAG TPA: hypothetical protein PKE68_03700, partial [Saprospiraceae bacterium]|nr:hypothetical protein [Saprospiraceae bacterium]
MSDFPIAKLTKLIRRGLPEQYLAGVILSYAVNAALIAFLLYPIFVSIAPGNNSLALIIVCAGSIVAQYFRYLIVFTDQLVPNGVQSSRFVVRTVAMAMWLFSAIEVYHATAATEVLTGSKAWSLTLFGWAIVTGGYILEISFVKKLNELTDSENNALYLPDSELKERIKNEQPKTHPNFALPQIPDEMEFD